MSKNEEKLSSTKYWISTTPSNFNQKVKDHLKDKYCSAIRKNEIVPFAITWMELGGIMQSKIVI